MKLFTKDDIEKMGLTYEPDITKCKVDKTKAYYGSIDVWDNGKSIERSTVMTLDEYSPKEYKAAVAQSCPFLCVHSFEVPDDVPPNDGHWDMWVCVRGHTRRDNQDSLMPLLKSEETVSKVRGMMQTLLESKQANLTPDVVKDMMESAFTWGWSMAKAGDV
jgi:hypothetical protein